MSSVCSWLPLIPLGIDRALRLHAGDAGHALEEQALDAHLERERAHGTAGAGADQRQADDLARRHLDQLDGSAIHLERGPDLVQRALDLVHHHRVHYHRPPPGRPGKLTVSLNNIPERTAESLADS